MHSRGELLLMLDADGATKISDLEKLENQVHMPYYCLYFLLHFSSGSSWKYIVLIGML